eukprot:TRINITY_DN13571_c0_g1_i1.p1 TRINITY_DN13571_c0_g1~~TRINITY_DN13571_c0_g1_i1.p1  ORF type:complete len:236 (+),score=38.46 TRINITY_DN13571_c0_g1_i1:1-708(+)
MGVFVMFIGHFGFALIATYISPEVSFGWLWAAALLPDLVLPFTKLLGLDGTGILVNSHLFMPLDLYSIGWSHSFVTSVAQAIALALVFRIATGRKRSSSVIAWLVMSHWIGDAITHRPDLPLYPGATLKLGLGLWDYKAAAILTEVALLLAGLRSLLSAHKIRTKGGMVALIAHMTVLGVLFLVSVLLPPPQRDIEWFDMFQAVGMWLAVPWAQYIGSQCEPNSAGAAKSASLRK